MLMEVWAGSRALLHCLLPEVCLTVHWPVFCWPKREGHDDQPAHRLPELVFACFLGATVSTHNGVAHLSTQILGTGASCMNFFFFGKPGKMVLISRDSPSRVYADHLTPKVKFSKRRVSSNLAVYHSGMKRLNRVYYICFLTQSVENVYMEYPIWEGTLATLATPTLLGVSRRKMIKTYPVTFSGVPIGANLHLEDTLRLLLLLLVACSAPLGVHLSNLWDWTHWSHLPTSSSFVPMYTYSIHRCT